MKRWWLETVRVLGPIVILVSGIGGFMAFGKRPDVKNEIPVPAVPTVETEVVAASPGEIVIELEGVATPARQITISAEVDGQVVKKAPQSRAGSFVSAGDLLLQIDPVNYRLEVDRLTAQVSQSRAELSAIDVQIESNEKLATLAAEEHAMQQRELQRGEQLAKRSAITESQLDTIRATELGSRRSLLTLSNEGALLVERRNSQKAALALAEAQLGRAEEDLKRTEVKSPLDGMVITDKFELNDFVKRGDQLLKINDTRHLEVTTSLTVDELYWVWMDSGLLTNAGEKTLKERMELPQKEVEVIFDLQGTEYRWKGILSRYDGTGLDAQTRTVPCRVLIENPTDVRMSKAAEKSEAEREAGDSGDPAIRLPSMYAGMYLTIRIGVKSPVALLEIPAVALRPGDEVWLVKEGKLRIEKPEVMRRDRKRIYLRQRPEGIRAGDHIVTSPLSFVRDDLPVQESITESGASVGEGTAP